MIDFQALYDWFTNLFKGIFGDVVNIINDLLVLVVMKVLQIVSYILGALPAPDFLNTHSLNSLAGGLGSDVLWFMSQTRIPEAFAMIGVAVGFRILRRFLTFGIW